MLIRAIINIWTLLLGIFILQLGNGLQMSLMVLRANFEGFASSLIGIVMSGYYVGILIGSFAIPHLIQKVGHIRVYAAFSATASALILAHLIWANPIFWWNLRFLTGFSLVAMYIVSESWINDHTTRKNRGQILTIYIMLSSLGLAIGQFLLNLGSPESFELFIISSMIISLAVIPMLLTLQSVPDISMPQSKMSIISLFKSSPLAVIAILGIGVCQGSFWALGPNYGILIGFSKSQISIMMALILLGSVALQFPAGRLSDRFDRRLILMAVSLISGILAILSAILLPTGHYSGYIAIFLLGGPLYAVYTIASALVNDNLEPHQMVRASSSLLIIYGLGAITGPILLGFIMSPTFPAIFFYSQAAILIIIAGFASIRSLTTDAVPDEDQNPLISVPPNTSPIAMAINEYEADNDENTPDS